MTKTISGIAASNGIAIAKAYTLVHPKLVVEKMSITYADHEMNRFSEAVLRATEELKKIRDHAKRALGDDKAAIFSAHLLVLNDPELVNPIKEKIKNELINAEYALQETASMFIQLFEQMEDEYMKERAADIKDVTKRLLSHLLNVHISDPSSLDEEVIIVTEDLTPSDTAQLNRKFVKGFTTDIGGRTSHSAIMARSMEIPAVVGTKSVTKEVQNGDLLIIDGNSGQVLINPSEEIIEGYREKMASYARQKQEWLKLKDEKSLTKDGHQVELSANIGSPSDIQSVLENGGEGVGLYRTEFLYMGRDTLPTEEEQFNAYRKVLEQMNGKPVVVRTLDIGGDKELPYLQFPKEMNPFLGYRAIRLCLDEQTIFRTQLRALLKASKYGNLKIMFPMIATIEEFKEARKILHEEKDILIKEGIEVADKIEIGMMVEIPSSAVMADIFAKEVDFFSIGTNDLIQYTFAVDRMNEKVSYLYQPYHPAILRLISLVIEAAHREGKWVGMCGEMAGDEKAIPILIGLGLDEFSMSASSILPARSQIKQLSKEELEKLKGEILSKTTSEEVLQYLKENVH